MNKPGLKPSWFRDHQLRDVFPARKNEKRNKEKVMSTRSVLFLTVAAIIAMTAGVAFAQQAAAPAAAAAPLTAAQGDKEAIKIELPEPFFGGTPLDYWSPTLEPEDYKDRAPYLAPKGTTLISKGKPVTSSAKAALMGDLKQITDGDKDYTKTSLVELPAGPQWVQVDLQQDSTIYAVLVWHFHEGKRVYFDVIVQVSGDPEFKSGVTTVYNNDSDNSSGQGVGKDKEYIENNKGRLIGIDNGVKGRYVRLCTNGNTANELNHCVEVEVFGQPAK